MVNKDLVSSLVGHNTGEYVRIIRHEQVCEKLKLSSAKLFDMVAKGQFPKPFTIVPGGRAVGWLEYEVDAWILSRKDGQQGGGK